MRVSVEGNLRRRTRIGFGVFRKERWNDEPFHWEQVVSPDSQEKSEHVLDAFRIGCLPKAERVFINATIRGRPYVLGEVQMDVDRNFSFSILSVSGMEIHGRIHCETLPS